MAPYPVPGDPSGPDISHSDEPGFHLCGRPLLLSPYLANRHVHPGPGEYASPLGDYSLCCHSCYNDLHYHVFSFKDIPHRDPYDGKTVYVTGNYQVDSLLNSPTLRP